MNCFEYHVSPAGDDAAPGTALRPFRTISRAAALAKAGDRVVVHGGTYREWVRPANGGKSDTCRIVYEAAPGERPVIKGSERVSCWEDEGGGVWKATLPNTLFGGCNPYAEALGGDWFLYPEDGSAHAGDVYLNGKSFYEAKSLGEVRNPHKRTEGMNPPWTKRAEAIPHPEDTLYVWYAEVGGESTTVWANFHGADPNAELTEINVRECCFYPEKTGCNYITVRGFEMAQAACPWTPPTADQPGLLGTHWSRGWVIEDNVIHDAKCSGISIGKEESTGHNLCTRTHRKPGYQYQMEAVFLARQAGWSRETIGSHVIRRNTVYDCGQNGIVGHMGCVFSEIYDNHIYNIAVKHEFFGYEIAGIKLHAAIDVQVRHNNIHDCTLGAWFDWQAQGARVTGNLFYRNDRDLMVEVTHGPHLIDNNIFASAYNFDNIAQGGAFVHNLCCGTMRREPVLNRATPYHFPHTTEVAGTTFVYGGDDRFYQNIFVGGAPVYTEQSKSGTADYDGSPVSLEEYEERVVAQGPGDLDRFEAVRQPAYIARNAYLAGAPAFEREEGNFLFGEDPQARIVEEEGGTFLELTVPAGLPAMETRVVDTAELGMVRLVEASFETPCGGPIAFDTDYLGAQRGERPLPGPIEGLCGGRCRVRVW